MSWAFKGRFTRYNFVSCDMITTSLRHELFRVNQAYNLLTIVVYDIKNVVGFLKHVLKLDDNRSHRQFDIVEIVYDFPMTRALKIARDNSKQKSYRVNRSSRVYGNSNFPTYNPAPSTLESPSMGFSLSKFECY